MALPDAGRGTIDAAVYRIIQARRAKNEDRGDLLSMLLLAHDTDSDGGRMSDLQLRDEAMTIFLAGHETSANAMSWTWYLLSQHPEVEGKFHEEIDRHLGGLPPRITDVVELSLTGRIFSEALRLYPPLWAIGRCAMVDCQIGSYTIPRGSVVILSSFVTQRDPRWFPEPLRFDPERCRPAAKLERPRFSYFPAFGRNVPKRLETRPSGSKYYRSILPFPGEGSRGRAARLDIPAWCEMRGQEYVGEEPADHGAAYVVRRVS